MNLLRFFHEWGDEKTQFRIYLKEEPLPELPQENEFFQYRVINGKFLWSRFFLPLHLNTKKEIDVFFAPAHYAPPFCPVPLVVTIHDLAFFYFPNEFLKKDLYKLQNWTKSAVTSAKKVISVSKWTKKDLMKFYELPEKKIEVVYNGFEKNIDTSLQPSTEDVLQKFNIQKEKYLWADGNFFDGDGEFSDDLGYEAYVMLTSIENLTLFAGAGYEDVDDFGIGGVYTYDIWANYVFTEKFSLAAEISSVEDITDLSWLVQGTYALTEDLTVSGRVTGFEDDTGIGADALGYGLASTYTITPNFSIKGEVTETDVDGGSDVFSYALQGIFKF